MTQLMAAGRRRLALQNVDRMRTATAVAGNSSYEAVVVAGRPSRIQSIPDF